MQHLSRRTLLAAGAAGALASGLAGRGAQAQTRWQFATPYPDGKFHTRNVRQFVEEAQQASAGRLQIQLHSNAALLKALRDTLHERFGLDHLTIQIEPEGFEESGTHG